MIDVGGIIQQGLVLFQGRWGLGYIILPLEQAWGARQEGATKVPALVPDSTFLPSVPALTSPDCDV